MISNVVFTVMMFCAIALVPTVVEAQNVGSVMSAISKKNAYETEYQSTMIDTRFASENNRHVALAQFGCGKSGANVGSPTDFAFYGGTEANCRQRKFFRGWIDNFCKPQGFDQIRCMTDPRQKTCFLQIGYNTETTINGLLASGNVDTSLPFSTYSKAFNIKDVETRAFGICCKNCDLNPQ